MCGKELDAKRPYDHYKVGVTSIYASVCCLRTGIREVAPTTPARAASCAFLASIAILGWAPRYGTPAWADSSAEKRSEAPTSLRRLASQETRKALRQYLKDNPELKEVALQSTAEKRTRRAAGAWCSERQVAGDAADAAGQAERGRCTAAWIRAAFGLGCWHFAGQPLASGPCWPGFKGKGGTISCRRGLMPAL